MPRATTLVFFLIGMCVVVLVALALYQRFHTSPSSSLSVKFADRSHQTITIGTARLTVEVVNTPESMTQGLSGRSQIGADGMLFIFPQPKHATFWMKEMQFPLDMIWIHKGRVTGVTEDVPYPLPETPLDQLPTYSSPGLADMVLELPAGMAEEYGVEVGSVVVLTQ
ncbi:MAG: DUF192 domain-containing protein [Pseudomonadales bacterium]|nr:DUF192 domain-containing protein [Candidatus Woesebacteria bacterium]MCB9801804.1 DUF192 domain-containing protein [Pseudomonadales bacterium]